MVHDPRVSTLLSRLGGTYRDPARVDRDASSLLKSSVGVHLTPGIAPLVENNGDTSHCLVLQGTIAIVFRGTTYQLLVDIYLPPGYAIRPPVSYVRLAPNMYLKENHPHVGSDGMVYLPYTHEWNPRTHSLIEMVVAMSSVFSADPPCFTRSAPAPPPPPSQPPSTSSHDPPPPAYNDGLLSSTSSSNTTPYVRTTTTTTDSDRYMQEQIEAIMAKEAEEANRAAEIARQAAIREEQDREKQAEAQKVWQEKKKLQVKDQLNQKINSYLKRLEQETKTSVQSDWRDQEQLKLSKASTEKQLESLQKKKAELEQHVATVDSKTAEIEQWLEEAKGNDQAEETNVDDICQPVSKLHVQMMDLSAENAALTDAMYFLDKGMYMGQMDCTTHLKSVRKLAKRQFLVRAHLMKIGQAVSSKTR